MDPVRWHLVKELAPPEYIDSDDALKRLAERLERRDMIAVDTEADSFHHYREKVCLIQITAGDEDVLVDPLAVRDLEPLRGVMENPKQVKIFHDAGYDLIGLRRDFGWAVEGIFDTMWASRLLGVQNFGLAAVLKERFAFEVDKRHQRSDWAQRPLTHEQIDYARLDTHFLPRLASLLTEELQHKGRYAWALEDFERMPRTAERVGQREPRADPDAWWRIKGVKQLSPAARGRARALWQVRETLAKRLDRPPFKIFGDVVILDLAKNPPKPSETVLRPRKGLRRAGVDRFGGQILRALREAEPVKGPPPPGSGRRRRAGRFLDPDARALYEELRTLRAKIAKRLELDPEVALANATLEDLARQPPGCLDDLLEAEVLQGWRGAIFNEAIINAVQVEER